MPIGRCAYPATPIRFGANQIIFATMADDLVPSPPEPKLRGNSAAYLRSRLERDGHVELLTAIDRGELSVFGAACEVGYVTRPIPSGNGSPNARKRREWAIARAYRGSARADAALAPEGPPNGREAPHRTSHESARSTPLIDLAAAIAEWEEAQRPAPPRERDVELERELVRERKPAPAALPPEPVFSAHPALPCTSCREPQATAALREVVDLYVCAVRGEPHRTGNILPGACCQRQLLGRLDVKALVA
jgi:hypothetical protein